VRLRDIAASLGITERSAYGIVADLTAAGYVVKQEDGRRNRYQIQAHLPLPETTSQQPAIGEVPALLAGASETAGDPDQASLGPPQPGGVHAPRQRAGAGAARPASSGQRSGQVGVLASIHRVNSGIFGRADAKGAL
jgi:predicted DNA-binding transcriptional regulator YafY